MQLTWMPERRRFIGTQTEAKAEKTPFEVREVPIVKAELIVFLNETEQAHEAELAALRTEIETLRGEGDDVVDGTAGSNAGTAANDQTPMAAAPGGGDLVDQILDLPIDRLPRVLSAAIGRLGEVAGGHGWAAFGKDVYAWTPAARSVEQGLGMLMLAAFETMGADAKPKPVRVRPIAPIDGGGE